MNVTDSSEPEMAGAPASEQFRVVMSARGHGTLVVPHGELDVSSASALQAVLEAQTGVVTVDLRELTFVDACGLGVLLDAEARSRADGLNLTFVAGDAVQRLLDLVELPDPFTYVEPPTS
jgi:anti-anti-sigma factor